MIKYYFFSIFGVFISTTILGQSNQTNHIKARFNHLFLVVDSTTYAEVTSSGLLKSMGYSYEKNSSSWQAFYLIGQDNYLEIMHPNSMTDTSITLIPSDNWTCLASLRAQSMNQFEIDRTVNIEIDQDEQFYNLYPLFKDSIIPMTTWEMRKKQYESWTGKTYHDSLSFLPVDYNSPADSDSSKAYPIQNIIGIDYKINSDDTLVIFEYLKLNSYHQSKQLIFSNDSEKFYFQIDSVDHIKVSGIRFRLTDVHPIQSIKLGNSQFNTSGLSARWTFDLPDVK